MITETTSTTNNAGSSPAPREALQRAGEVTDNNEGVLMNHIRVILAVSLVAILTACGGGGGSSPTTTAASSSTPTTTAAPSDVGTLTTPTYPAGSEALAAFNQINSFRQTCGFPALDENSKLDTSVANHWNYVNLNGGPNVVGHYETSGNPGFTGYDPAARATAAGYPLATAGEVIAPMTTNVGGSYDITALASVPYHGGVLFGDWAETGIIYQQLSSSAGAYYEFIEDFGDQSNAPAAPAISQAPLTYPCQGATNVERENLAPESPTPYVNGFPANDAPGSWGTPLIVEGNLSDSITLSSVSVTGPSGTVPVSFYDSTTDPNHELLSWEAFAIPNAPLAATTTYSVVINGAINGTPFSRSFSFTTGN
ncbi:putative uncharacterized protein [Burkholderiales bacterium GJ-E10]|nr:putative uncharacterized protein [Burkholderiales bacterium GJ-E10]